MPPQTSWRDTNEGSKAGEGLRGVILAGRFIIASIDDAIFVDIELQRLIVPQLKNKFGIRKYGYCRKSCDLVTS